MGLLAWWGETVGSGEYRAAVTWWLMVGVAVLAIGLLAFAGWWRRRPSVQRDMDALRKATEDAAVEMGAALMPAFRKMMDASERMVKVRWGNPATPTAAQRDEAATKFDR